MSAQPIQPIRGPGVIASSLPFSPAIRAGDFLFVSGMASADERGQLIPDTFENEARRTYGNLGRILDAAGLDFSRVVQVRCYLSSRADWDAHNRIYREFFAEPYPARTTLIGCLGDLVKYEVDLIAYAGESGRAPRRDDVRGAIRTSESSVSALIGEGLRVPVACDILDDLGLRQQAMHHRLRPLDPENCTFIGRARTFRWMETDYVVEDDPYGLEIEAMDSLRAGDVVVHSTDPGWTNAPWGELMSTLAHRQGVAGCVCDSNIRDCRQIMELGFPVFHAGIRPLDSKGRGRVMAYDVPVRCGDVLVRPGELVFCDFDGVVVIPKAVETEVLRRAVEKVGRENATRRELLAGRSLREVYDEFGVL